MSSDATRKAHEVSFKMTANRDRMLLHRQREAEKRVAEREKKRYDAARQIVRDNERFGGTVHDPMRPVAAGTSARSLAAELDPAEREKRVQARLRVEEKARERAIYEAAHPKPKDPRSVAERLAAGEGQAYLRG